MAALPASRITETKPFRLFSRLDRKLGFRTTNTPSSLPVPHITEASLFRLFSRLDRKLSFSATNTYTTPQPLPTSLSHAKIAASLEYVRQLLLTLEKESDSTHNLTLEKESDSIRNLTQHQNALSKLSQQKMSICRLNETLQITAHKKGVEGSDSGDDSDVGEGALGAIRSDSEAGIDESSVYSLDPTAEHRVSSPREGPRNCFDTQKEEHAANSSGSGAQGGEDDVVFLEKQLDSQRHEQEALIADMLTLAQQLKLSRVYFHEGLQEEEGLRDLAADGLNKNILRIERIGRKMDTLMRNENVGRLWGILYPVIIVALMFLILFIVFFAPKLR